MDDQKKSLELQRVSKSRDCIKAEWNENLKVVIVPYLKGKTTQHMGKNLKGNCALSPQEALFLLENGLLQIEFKSTRLRVEEAYIMMLKGPLSREKYKVYSSLTQKGFIVVHHQSRIGPSFNQLMNLEKKTERKRKAADVNDSPERRTFKSVLASNSEVNSVNAENNALFNDSVLSNSDSQKVLSVSENTVYDHNVIDSLQINETINSETSITVSPYFENRINSNDSVAKNMRSLPLEELNKDVGMLEDSDDKIQVLKVCPVQNTGNNQNSFLYDLRRSLDQIHRDLKEYYSEYDKINSETSVTVSPDMENRIRNYREYCKEYERINSEASIITLFSGMSRNNTVLSKSDYENSANQSGPSKKEFDDDVTFIEVKKTEKPPPLAVIDLLFDDDDNDDKKDDKSSNVLSSDVEKQDASNGQEIFEDSDDEIQTSTKLAIPDVLKPLQIKQRANVCDANCLIDRSVPNTPSLEISFDVYLPNSKYRRSAPGVPNHRIIVLGAADPFPSYSDMVCLKKKWNDKATLQLAVVDNCNVSFYSFNNLSVPKDIPFES